MATGIDFFEDTDKEERILMKHNSLVKSRYSLTLAQNRVYETLLYKFQKDNLGELECTLPRKEILKLLKSKEYNTVKGISNLLEQMRIKKIMIRERIDDTDHYKWHRYGLINGATYNDQTDTFTVKATSEIYSLVTDYYGDREGHTPINLIVKLSMKNYYAQRLYDLLRVWSGTKHTINYKVDELKAALQIEDKYSTYSSLKRSVILPAIKELNATGYFEIDLKENKTKRKITSIDFIVKDLDKRVYFNKKIDNNTSKDINVVDSNIKQAKSAKKDFEIVEEFEESQQLTFKPKFSRYADPLESVVSSDYTNNENRFLPFIAESGERLYIRQGTFEPKLRRADDINVFSVGTKRIFKRDFEGIDFTLEHFDEALNEAIGISLERDEVEIIKTDLYRFFKSVLISKLIGAHKAKLEEMEQRRKWNDIF